MVCHSTLNQVMRNGIKECFDVQIDNPVSVPDSAAPADADCVERRLPGAIAVRVGMNFGSTNGSNTIFTTVCAM